MEAVVVTSKEFATMMAVSEPTARALMERIPESFNVGLGKRKSFRLSIEKAKAYAEGMLTIPVQERTNAKASALKGKKKTAPSTKASKYVAYRK